MFTRWRQENFFKYMMENYDMDKIAFCIINQVDAELTVVNPRYSKLTYDIIPFTNLI